MADSEREINNNVVAISKWFGRILLGLLPFAVLWCTWVSVQLVTIGVRVIDYKDVQLRVVDLDSKLGLVQARVGTMDERLHQVESDVRQLREHAPPSSH